jgi:crotonobetainyl-CoA:carnitine CoA-transferase CaiB-like acyl-CoA transferase
MSVSSLDLGLNSAAGADSSGTPARPVDSLPLKQSASMDLLAGVKVLDLTTSIAGPYAGQLLGDLGAEVLKVERPSQPDDSRAWGPPFLDGESLWFLSVNRNKRGVAIDYGQAAGHALLMRLVAQADVVILNLVGRVQKKLGLDAESLAAVNSKLIHVSVTGFGIDGQRADLPCYDLIAEGWSGVMDMTGEPDSPPQKVGTPAADLLAGHDAAMAVMAALLRRSRDGRGCVVDVSMMESMSRFMAPRLVPYLGTGELMRRSGGRDSVIAIYQVFETADEPMTLALGNDAIWRRFWAAVGEPEVADTVDYATNALRRAARETIVKRISSLLLTQPRAHWLRVLGEARVPAGPIQRLDQFATDPELRERGFLYASLRGDSRIPQVGLGIRFDGCTEGSQVPPPVLGADTEAVLESWLSLGAEEIAQLRTQHII